MNRFFNCCPPRIEFLRIRSWRGSMWICKNVFPMYHVYPKCLAALLCGAAIRMKASTACGLQALGKTQKTSAPKGDHLSIPHPGHWHPAAEQQSPLRRDPSRCSSQAGRTMYLALRRPDCTLSRPLRFSSRRGRPAGDPVDSDPGAKLPWSPP